MNRNVAWARVAGWVVGVAGIAALPTIGLFLAFGQPWGTINDLALIVMTAAIPVLMLAFWELGGLTPTPLARLAQVTGWLAAAVWCGTHILYVLGVVAIDYEAVATGAYAVEAVALIVIGLWIAGANLLAGPWLSAIRLLGIVSGLLIVLFAAGTLVQNKDGMLVMIGGIGYLLLLPIWGFVMAVYLRRIG